MSASASGPDAIHQSAIRMHRSASLGELLETIASEAKRLLRADHCFVYLYDPKWRDLHGRRTSDEDEIRFPLGQGLAGLAASNGTPLRTANAPREPAYVAEIDSPPSGEAPSVLVAPLKGDGGACMGVVEVLAGASRTFGEDDEAAAMAIAEHAAVAIERVRNYERDKAFLLDLAAAMAGAADRRFLSTLDHTYRVREYCKRLAKAAELPPDKALALEVAAILHDIGRVELDLDEEPDGTFSAATLERMKPHVLFAEAMLRGVSFPESLAEVPQAVLCHHEFLDGSGYPHGRTAESIPTLARMLAVADSFDAFLQGRRTPGSKPSSEEEAIRYLKKGSGRLFDPGIVSLFIDKQCYAIEQRRFPRIDYQIPVDVILLGSSGLEERRFETEALDISEGGLLFWSAEPIQPHSLVRLLMHFPSEKIEAIAKVARVLPGDGRRKKIGAYFLWYGTVD